MVGNLQEIRTAVLTYLDTKVSCSISTITAAVPVAISPNEDFKFDVTATNAVTAAGGVRLKNVCYVITASNNVKLVVPPASVGKAISIPIPPFGLSINLNPGQEVSGYILTPAAADPKILNPGETDTIKNLPGKAKSLGGFSICAHIQAEVDLSYLFPVGNCPDGCRRGSVV